MSSADPGVRELPSSLRRVARESIEHGLRTGRAPSPDPAGYAEELREPGACFVTLRRSGELRGCTGSLEARRPLVQDAAQNAWGSASADPRFPPLTRDELYDLEISVAVLSAPDAFPVASEAELLKRLRPGVDGLILQDGARRATFLPSVWASLPRPEDFLDALRQKAGLPTGYWSPRLRFERYTTREAS